MPGRDLRPPRELLPRPEESRAEATERMRQAVAALERVRTQLARTQRTLDAFVDQISAAAATPATDEPPTAPEPAPTAPVVDRVAPPASIAEHVVPPGAPAGKRSGDPEAPPTA